MSALINVAVYLDEKELARLDELVAAMNAQLPSKENVLAVAAHEGSSGMHLCYCHERLRKAA